MTFTYTWTSIEQTELKAQGDNGELLLIPAVDGNRHYAEFLASGATAEPYVEPPYVEPEPTELELLATRVSAIESNEIIDDATDTSLLLALANAASRIETLETANASLEARIAALEGNP